MQLQREREALKLDRKPRKTEKIKQKRFGYKSKLKLLAYYYANLWVYISLLAVGRGKDSSKLSIRHNAESSAKGASPLLFIRAEELLSSKIACEITTHSKVTSCEADFHKMIE